MNKPSPFILHHYASVTSTHDVARQLLQNTKENVKPFVVYAQEQTAGRGRQGRSWFSPQGVLTATWVVPHQPSQFGQATPNQEKKAQTSVVALIAGLAVCDAISTHAVGRALQIKWPNDIWLDQSKVVGILCETAHISYMDHTHDSRADLIGIGVNVCCRLEDLPKNLNTAPTSLWPAASDHQQSWVQIEQIRDAISLALHHRLLAEHRPTFSEQLNELAERDVLMGHWVRVQGDGNVLIEGRASGIDHEGCLIVQIAGGPPRRVFAGEVEHVEQP